MKKIILILTLCCSLAQLAFGQQLPAYDRTRQNQVLDDRATWSRYFMGPPKGPTPMFPSYVPDSLKCGALFVCTGTAPGLYRYDCDSAKWLLIGTQQTGKSYADSLYRHILNGNNTTTGNNSHTGTEEYSGAVVIEPGSSISMHDQTGVSSRVYTLWNYGGTFEVSNIPSGGHQGFLFDTVKNRLATAGDTAYALVTDLTAYAPIGGGTLAHSITNGVGIQSFTFNNTGAATVAADTAGTIVSKPYLTNYVTANAGIIYLHNYGAIGDGVTEDSTAFKNAIAAAKLKGWEVWGDGNKTYKISSRNIYLTDTTNLYRVPALRHIRLNLGAVRGDTTNRVTVFHDDGKKAFLQSGVTGITQNSNTVTLNTGLSLSPGDVIYIVSMQTWVQPSISDYYTGQRCTVSSYNSTTGVLTINGTFNVSVTSAYIYKNVWQPRLEIEDCDFYATAGNNLACIYNTFNFFATVGTNKFKNFGYVAIANNSNEAHINDAIILNSNLSGNGLSYGVSAWDLSLVYINDCTIQGGRNCITGGGGLTWFENMVGGTTTSQGCVYPGEYYVNGGKYETDVAQGYGAFDAHSNMWRASVRNCFMTDGIYIGAVNNVIENVQINTSSASQHGIEISYGNASYSTLLINNVDLNLQNFTVIPFTIDQSIYSAIFNHFNIHGNQTANHPVWNQQFGITNYHINDLSINVANSATQTNYNLFTIGSDVNFQNININNASTEFLPTVAGLNIKCSNCSFTNSPWSYGVEVIGTTNKPKTVVFDNPIASGNYTSGIFVNTSSELQARNGRVNDNGVNTGASNNNRAGIFAASTDSVTLVNVDTRPQLTGASRVQTYGFAQSAGTSYSLLFNKFQGNLVSPDYLASGTAKEVLGNTGDATIADVLQEGVTINVNGVGLALGNSNTAGSITWGGNRASAGYNGSNVYIAGSSGKGAEIDVNGTTAGLTISSANVMTIGSPKINVPTATNGPSGFATLVAGTVTVSNTSVTSNSIIVFTRKTAGGTIGTLSYTVSSGASFTITSSSSTDTSQIGYFILN